MTNSSGFLLLDKPSGPTSHDIINFLRQITSIKKIGHAGTLDPFASGLLIVGIGRQATRHLGKFLKLDKKYEATLRLGSTSDSFDRTGRIVSFKCSPPSLTEIKKTAQCFKGEIEQIPPMFSAKKVGGKRLYELARAGQEIERQPIKILIYQLKVLSYQFPFLRLWVHCSSGTYIRALAADFGKVLGCGAYLEELRRTAIGEWQIEEAVKPNQINYNNWQQYLFVPKLIF
ncbi:tRNA pseudouridine(55) synthase TruB [Candidatus Parcubacteria bacterium]|nr:MAG: tRNA pseudouridine(55) synthase TruB [Candidatus Parcubacteria bacterium]